MVKLARMVFGALLLCTLAGCNLSFNTPDPRTVFSDPAAYEATDDLVAHFLARDAEKLFERAYPDDGAEISVERFEAVLAFLPDGENVSASMYYAENRMGQGEWQGTPVYLSTFDLRNAEGDYAELVLAVAPHDAECCFLSYYRITPTNVLPSKYYDWNLSEKSPLHWFFFALLFVVPIFIVVSMIACFREKGLLLKWLWMILMAFGYWGVQFNWATGEVRNLLFHVSDTGVFYFSFFKVQLLGAGFLRSGLFQPWMISIGIPIVAIIYWIRRFLKKSPDDNKPDYAH